VTDQHSVMAQGQNALAATAKELSVNMRSDLAIAAFSRGNGNTKR